MNTGRRKPILITYKIIFALLGLSAVANEIITLVKRSTFIPQNFFSFFTIQSNLFMSVMLIVGAYALAKNIQNSRIDALRGAATLYMVLTGIVFALLLSGLDPRVLTAQPWDNYVLHYIIPIVAALDWIIDPPTSRIRKRTVGAWLIYPLAYLAYTLIRGPIAQWYPYPFVNPALAGYWRIALVCTAITVGVVIGGFVVRAWSLRGTREKPANLL